MQNYESEIATHPHSSDFARELVGVIKMQMRIGKQIKQIRVTGFADGEHNSGIEYDWLSVPPPCRTGDQSVDDVELALLRSCIIILAISDEIGPNYAGTVTWKKEYIDEPDGGKSGYPHRKTKVQVLMR